MRYSLGCELGYRVQGPTVFLFNIQPALVPQQVLVREALTIAPDLPVESFTVPETANRYLRLTAPAGELKLRYEAEVDLEVCYQDGASVGEIGLAELPFAALPHLNPSRYCQADRFARTASGLVQGIAPGHGRVTALCNWIHDEVAYLRGSSDSHTSAPDTLVERAGVCRDFAHLGITLCRALNIPARFVSAYALGLVPPDFHAVFEAYLGGRWYLFDPTRQAVLDGMVRIGVGRDAGDVAFATIYGPAVGTQIRVWMEPADGAGLPAQRTVSAVSVSEV